MKKKEEDCWCSERNDIEKQEHYVF